MTDSTVKEPVYLARLEGGPAAGDRITHGPWPLPNTIIVPGGVYRKMAESQLEEDVPGLIRGATYTWEPTP